MLKNCIYIKKLLFLSVLSIELLLLQLPLSMTLFPFLSVGTTRNQGLRAMRGENSNASLRFIAVFSSFLFFFFPFQLCDAIEKKKEKKQRRRKRMKQNLQALHFSAFLSIMHRDKHACSCVSTSFDVIGELDWKETSCSVNGATWTEPMLRERFPFKEKQTNKQTEKNHKGTFPKQRLKPRTYLFISLVYSFCSPAPPTHPRQPRPSHLFHSC